MSDMRNRHHVQPLLTWSTSCIPGVLTGYYQPGQLSPGFSELVTAPPPPFSSRFRTGKVNAAAVNVAERGATCDDAQRGEGRVSDSRVYRALDNISAGIVARCEATVLRQQQRRKSPATLIYRSMCRFHFCFLESTVLDLQTGSTTQWQAYLAPKEMAASDMRNRCHVQWLLTWSTNAAHPVSLESLQVLSTLPLVLKTTIYQGGKQHGSLNFATGSEDDDLSRRKAARECRLIPCSGWKMDKGHCKQSNLNDLGIQFEFVFILLYIIICRYRLLSAKKNTSLKFGLKT
ncbi:hypothetical protein LAZ67_7000650 [Cordylochernes scorpioides]|uniref:Uncharacterized protein n=1 Tax=Cordylochernes scorpioides TaxID=51811 RepID=A0ABY6KLN1_9ARAC|nr:hypothetical protein LAZ67_7000650 [Cordylochernes scorpioides]